MSFAIFKPYVPPSVSETAARNIRLNYFICIQNLIPAQIVFSLIPLIVDSEAYLSAPWLSIGYFLIGVTILIISNQGYFKSAKILHVLFANIYGLIIFSYMNPAGAAPVSWISKYYIYMSLIPLLIFELDVRWERFALVISVLLGACCDFAYPYIDPLLNLESVTISLDILPIRVFTTFIAYILIGAAVVYLKLINKSSQSKVLELLQDVKNQNEELMMQEEELRQGQEELLATNQKLEEHQHNLEDTIRERTATLAKTVEAEKESRKEVELLLAKLKEDEEELKQSHANLAEAKAEIEKVLGIEQANMEKLAAAHKSLQNTQMQLVQSEKMAGLGQMTAGVAHEINNPVNFISAGVQSLQVIIEDVWKVVALYEKMDALPEKEKEAVKKQLDKLKEEVYFEDAQEDTKSLLMDIAIGANRTSEIVQGLKNFSRLDEEDQKLADLHEGIDSTLVILRNKYKGRIEIHKSFDDSIGKIDCFPGQLNQVFMNILSNAIDAIEGNGSINITTENHPNEVKIIIADTGKGISAEAQSKIFDPFFTTKDVGKGTGLGLSISHGIIERHRGTIAVSSAINEGTTFTITLPK